MLRWAPGGGRSEEVPFLPLALSLSFTVGTLWYLEPGPRPAPLDGMVVMAPAVRLSVAPRTEHQAH